MISINTPFQSSNGQKPSAVIFFYAGYFSQKIISAMAEAVRLRLDDMDTSSSQCRKVFSSFVEMTQNIVHYSNDTLTDSQCDDGEIRRGSVCIMHTDNHYVLLSSNPIPGDSVERLESRLSPLREMPLDDIKKAYRRALRQEQDPESNSKGAGLGFLTLARDASEPLEFYFSPDPDDPQSTLFCIKAVI